jgi:hypothetical protein
MPYAYLAENTASLWMNVDNTADRYPLNGQGSNTATAASSLTANGAAARPVIIEAVEVQSCATAVSDVLIKNHAGTTLWTIKVPVLSATQWFPMGGAYGVRLESGFCAAVSSTTNLTGVKIYFRWA